MAIPPGSDTPVACTAQWQVEGVQFKAIPLPAGDGVNDTANSIDFRRNLLAYWCFGTAQLAALDVGPFTFNPAYRGLDQLASTDLTPCDLPLCVFYWDSGTITFVDNWSVRRRMTRPDVSGAPWSAALADQRSADGEARFLQFQDQISDLVSRGVSRKTVASQTFGTLPPVGFLPVAPSQFVRDVATFSQGTGIATVSTDAAAAAQSPGILSLEAFSLLQSRVSQSGPESGFVPDAFFGPLGRPGGYLTWDTAYFALRQSYFLEPVATAEPVATERETGPGISYYYVVENLTAALNANERNQPTVPLYIVFMKNQHWVIESVPPFKVVPLFFSQ